MSGLVNADVYKYRLARLCDNVSDCLASAQNLDMLFESTECYFVTCDSGLLFFTHRLKNC